MKAPAPDKTPSEPASRSALRLPSHLKRRIGKGAAVRGVKRLLRGAGLETVCESARCPNLGACFGARTATFLILGPRCTRACRFCAIGERRGPVELPNPDEPAAVAGAAARLGLRHVVVTSVDRDDLPDGGAGHFRATLQAIADRLPEAAAEVLTPDFQGRAESVRVVTEGTPLRVFNHNVETVPRLYEQVRPRARYEWSLGVLEQVARERPDVVIKSGLMVGLGERPEEVFRLLTDLRDHGVQIVTIGQYLRPSLRAVPVQRYLDEASYETFREHGRALGLRRVVAGPLVRSSYQAALAL